MNESYTVYDVIEVLRLTGDMSGRKLATRAGVSTATLASLITRQPSTMSPFTLDKIARVFDLRWNELLNRPATIADELLAQSRVPTRMSKEDIEAVGKRLNPDGVINFLHLVESVRSMPRAASSEDRSEERARAASKRVDSASSGKAEFRNSIFFVLEKLNDDGLMEAMRRILDIANDPQYCKKQEKS